MYVSQYHANKEEAHFLCVSAKLIYLLNRIFLTLNLNIISSYCCLRHFFNYIPRKTLYSVLVLLWYSRNWRQRLITTSVLRVNLETNDVETMSTKFSMVNYLLSVTKKIFVKFWSVCFRIMKKRILSITHIVTL